MLIETLEFDDDIFAAGRYKSFSLYFCCEIDNDTSYKVNKCFLDSENGLCLEKQIKRENQIKHLKEINFKCTSLKCFLAACIEEYDLLQSRHFIRPSSIGSSFSEIIPFDILALPWISCK